jgi:aspartate racemase
MSVMKRSEPRMIGVLGGMGPQATVDFLAKVIAATPATCDQQHVPMIVHQVPQIPDRSTAILAGAPDPAVVASPFSRPEVRIGREFMPADWASNSSS